MLTIDIQNPRRSKRSDIVPFDLQIEIIKLLPVKSLFRFRQVSKSWKSLIDSSDFMANYRFPLQHHLLVRLRDTKREQFFSIVDDDDHSFPRHKSPLIAPLDDRLLSDFPDIIGSSQGVLCLCSVPQKNVFLRYDPFVKPHPPKTETCVVLWNPTIRKSIPIVVPNVFNNTKFETAVGFGVCPCTRDPKLVKINYISSLRYMNERIPWQVEVFSLSSGSWRSLSMSVPRASIEITWNQVCINEVIYWVATDRTHKKNLILSFDMITEEFTEIDLPDDLTYLDNRCLCLSKLCASLVVLQTEHVTAYLKEEYCVWRMEDGVKKSFTKLFVIKSPCDSLAIVKVHEFRKTGELIIDMLFRKSRKGNEFFVYEPVSRELTNTGIVSGGCTCSVKSYIQTLLLLDQ